MAMIVINTNTSNLIAAQLRPTSTLSSPNYLFQFSNVFQPEREVLFYATDESVYCNSYSLFRVIETGSTAVSGTALTNGIVNIYPTGEWLYNIYESTGTTLSVTATTGTILRTGKAIIIGNPSDNIPSIYI